MPIRKLLRLCPWLKRVHLWSFWIHYTRMYLLDSKGYFCINVYCQGPPKFLAIVFYMACTIFIISSNCNMGIKTSSNLMRQPLGLTSQLWLGKILVTMCIMLVCIHVCAHHVHYVRKVSSSTLTSTFDNLHYMYVHKHHRELGAFLTWSPL